MSRWCSAFAMCIQSSPTSHRRLPIPYLRSCRRRHSTAPIGSTSVSRACPCLTWIYWQCGSRCFCQLLLVYWCTIRYIGIRIHRWLWSCWLRWTFLRVLLVVHNASSTTFAIAIKLMYESIIILYLHGDCLPLYFNSTMIVLLFKCSCAPFHWTFSGIVACYIWHCVTFVVSPWFCYKYLLLATTISWSTPSPSATFIMRSYDPMRDISFWEFNLSTGVVTLQTYKAEFDFFLPVLTPLRFPLSYAYFSISSLTILVSPSRSWHPFTRLFLAVASTVQTTVQFSCSLKVQLSCLLT